jgi:hypothetical protein
MFILPFLLLVILLAGLCVHDVLSGPSGSKSERSRTVYGIKETVIQEQGKPFVLPPLTRIVRENKTRTYIPDLNLQEVTLENDALERWLDDGGTINRVLRVKKVVNIK